MICFLDIPKMDSGLKADALGFLFGELVRLLIAMDATVSRSTDEIKF